MQKSLYDRASSPSRTGGARSGAFGYRAEDSPRFGPTPVAGDGHLGEAQVLTLLHELGRELTSILDFEDLLRAAGTRIKSLVDYDLLSVMLLNEETQRLEHTFSLRYNERIYVQSTIALGQGLSGTAAKDKRPVRVGSVESDPRYVQCDAGLGVQSELVVPLLSKERVLGVIDLESLSPDAFSEDHERMLVTLSATLAIALENARLYDQLRRAEQRTARELERARRVQLALLPNGKPQLEGLDVAARYVPAQELGGDFYDFLPYGEGRLAVVVGDVAGKGAAAALLASLGIGLLREHAVQHPCLPEEMLADINGHLRIPGDSGQFVALALAVYDARSRELRLANAGLPAPLLVRDGRAEPLDVYGVPLGLFSDSDYQPVTVSLRSGDVVVFCSDGIYEQTNPQDEQYGVHRLASRLANGPRDTSADRVADDILAATDEHAGPQRSERSSQDDRTIVVLRVE